MENEKSDAVGLRAAQSAMGRLIDGVKEVRGSLSILVGLPYRDWGRADLDELERALQMCNLMLDPFGEDEDEEVT